VECVVEDGASVQGAVFTTGACKVAGTVKTTRKVNFEINPIDSKKKKEKKSRVHGGESNGSCYESNGLELTVIYCGQSLRS
jgi:hypothetical protein